MKVQITNTQTGQKMMVPASQARLVVAVAGDTYRTADIEPQDLCLKRAQLPLLGSPLPVAGPAAPKRRKRKLEGSAE